MQTFYNGLLAQRNQSILKYAWHLYD